MKNKYVNILLTMVISIIIGAILMVFMGYNPFEAYLELIKGAFASKLGFGNTLQKFVPILLTAFAFVVSARVGVFNVGVEGELYLGAITAAWIGYAFAGLPAPIHILLCFAGAIVVGALWASIPGSLKAYWGVNEICVTILMNYVAKYITSYLTAGPLSAGTGVAQTHAVPKSILLPSLLKPSAANAGLFIAIVVVVALFFLFYKTVLGYQLKTVGLNPKHAEYVGINPKTTVLKAMLISGGIGGIAGAIEVLGVYGYFLDNFSINTAFDGMLVALIVKNDPKMLPFMAFFLAVLKSGAQGMQQNTGVPKSIIDTIVAIFIVFATTEIFLHLERKKSAKGGKVKGEVA